MDAHQTSVLLVDDKPENLVALEGVLAPLGLNLVMAGSGEEALKYLLEQDFALILLDVQMPGMDGFETAELIRQRERTRHVPIIFVTAISKDAPHVFRGYRAGAVDYIFKPYDPLVLRSKVAVFVDLYRKSAALQASEQRFRAAFADAPIGKALVAVEGRLLKVNRALCSLLGYDQGRLLEKGLDGIVPDEERERHREHMRELLEGRLNEVQDERRLVRSDGEQVSVMMSLSLTRDAQGRPLDFVLQSVDITAHRRAEREATERLRERAARAEAVAIAQTVGKLQMITDAALAHLTLDDLLRELLGRIREIFGVDRATILQAERRGGPVAVGATLGPDGVMEQGVRIPVGQDFADRLSAARGPLALDELDSADVPNPLRRDDDVESLLAVPFALEGGVTGVLHIGTLTERRFTKEDGDLLQLVADRAALAIEHALLYEREHGLVEAFQRNLLPDRLPHSPGVELAARYLPGGRRAEVGGDWYDAIPLEDGRIGLVIGDVVGHGLEAAALMGRLRNALRAFAHEGHAPAAALAKLDRMVQSLEPGRTATVVYIVIEEDISSVCYAIAGHPPPLMIEPDGAAHYLDEGRAVPIGVLPDPTYTQHSRELPAGATLLLYTDGLVERRDAGLDAGMERLREAVKGAEEDVEELCEQVVAAMVGDVPAGDDVAMLALRSSPIGGERLRLELPAEPKELRRLRSTLSRWLEVAGASTDDSRAIQLACHEACSNAIEHGYRFGDAELEVEAALSDGEVVISIQDHGSWREHRDTNRGRGLPLIEGLMDSVEVSPGKEGTTVEMRRRIGVRGEADSTTPAGRT